MWLKLNAYNHNPLVTQCADKWRAREYVRAMGWEGVLNEVYGVWESAGDIPWGALPQSFVLKCNHGCGYNLICPNKELLDIGSSTQCIRKWLRTNFWRCYAEMQYRGIPKRVLCEKYLGDGGRLPGIIRYTAFTDTRCISWFAMVGGTAGPASIFLMRSGGFARLHRMGWRCRRDFSLKSR